MELADGYFETIDDTQNLYYFDNAKIEDTFYFANTFETLDNTIKLPRGNMSVFSWPEIGLKTIPTRNDTQISQDILHSNNYHIINPNAKYHDLILKGHKDYSKTYYGIRDISPSKSEKYFMRVIVPNPNIEYFIKVFSTNTGIR